MATTPRGDNRYRLSLSLGAIRDLPRAFLDELRRWADTLPFDLYRTADRYKTGGASFTNTALSGTSSVYVNCGSPVKIMDQPDGPVQVSAVATAMFFNYSDISIGYHRVGISLDGGSTYTYGINSAQVFGQGGLNLNRQSSAAVHWREGTPTGDIYLAVQAAPELSSNGSIANIRAVYTIIPQLS